MAGDPDEIVHLVRLAPAQQRVPAEARVSPHRNGHRRPRLPHAVHDPRQFIDHAGRRIDVRRPEPCTQHVRAAEDIQRQIAVVPVVAVEKAPFLLAVQRVVGGIDIEHDAHGRPRVGLDEQVDQQRIERRRVIAHLLVAVRLRARPRQLQPVQRALARQRRAAVRRPHPGCPGRVRLAHHRRQQRVTPQRVVVVEVFVAQRQSQHPLRY